MENTTIDLAQTIKDQKRAMRIQKREERLQAENEQKSHNRTVFYVWFVVILALFIGGAYGAERYAYWRADHQWQIPVKWIGFVKTLERTIISPLADPVKKELTKKEIIAKSRHPKQTDNIWAMESTRGTNNGAGTLQKYCEDLGETNEFGFGGMKNKICFKTFQESVDRVNQWLDDEEARTYCYYNIGDRITDCEYYKNINKL